MRILPRPPRGMLLVTGGGVVLLGMIVAAAVLRQRSEPATVLVVNQRWSTLYDLRLIHAEGEQPIAKITPGEVVEWRFHPLATGKIGLRSREMRYTEFQVAPGGTVRVVLSD